MHASLASAMQMATTRLPAASVVSARRTSYDTEASTAAAGALMLAQLARAARRPFVSAEDSVTTTRAVFQRRTLVGPATLPLSRGARRSRDHGPSARRARRAVVVPTRVCRAAAADDRGAVPRVRAGLPAAGLLTRAELVERLARATARRLSCSAAPNGKCCWSAQSARSRTGRASAARRSRCGPDWCRRCSTSTTSCAAASTVRRFAQAVFAQLRGERGLDRGTDSLIQQTCFLGFAFLAYERGLVTPAPWMSTG